MHTYTQKIKGKQIVQTNTHVALIHTHTHTHTLHQGVQFVMRELAIEVNWNGSTVKKRKLSVLFYEMEELSSA